MVNIVALIVFLFIVVMVETVIIAISWPDVLLRMKRLVGRLAKMGIVRIVRRDHRVATLLKDLSLKEFTYANGRYVVNKDYLIMERGLPTLYYAAGSSEPLDILNLGKSPILTAEEYDGLIEEAIAQGMLGKNKLEGIMFILIMVAAVGAIAAAVLSYNQGELMKDVINVLNAMRGEIAALVAK